MQKKPEIIVFAGPNGSGKSTITKMANIIEPYVNADDITGGGVVSVDRTVVSCCTALVLASAVISVVLTAVSVVFAVVAVFLTVVEVPLAEAVVLVVSALSEVVTGAVVFTVFTSSVKEVVGSCGRIKPGSVISVLCGIFHTKIPTIAAAQQPDTLKTVRRTRALFRRFASSFSLYLRKMLSILSS